MEEKETYFEYIKYSYSVSAEVNETMDNGKFLFHFYQAESRGETVPATLRYDQLYLRVMEVLDGYGQGISIDGGNAFFSAFYNGNASPAMEISMRMLRFDDSLYQYLLEFFEDIFLIFTQKQTKNGSVSA